MNFLKARPDFCKLRVILLLPPQSPGAASPTASEAQQHGSSKSSNFDCEFPPKLSVEQVKVPHPPAAVVVSGRCGARRRVCLTALPPANAHTQANLFSTIPALFPLSRKDFYLALSKVPSPCPHPPPSWCPDCIRTLQDEVLYDEEKRLVEVNEMVANKVLSAQTLLLFLLLIFSGHSDCLSSL